MMANYISIWPSKTVTIKYKAIIFDCDGTLVDSETLTNGLIAQMLTEHGVPTSTSASFELFAGKSFADIEQYLEQQTGNFPDGSFETEFRKRCKPLFESELKPVGGIPHVLKELSSLNIKMCVASNGPQVKMGITIKTTGLDIYFPSNLIFSAYDIQKWKPEPDLFLFAAKQIDVDPSDCLVIEDSVSGINGAINAGIDVIAYNPHSRSDIEELKVKTVSQMTDILNLLH